MSRRGTLSNMLRKLRSRLGEISQEELARRVGVSWSTVNRWENGKGKPSPLAREKLATLMRESGLAVEHQIWT